MKTFRATFFSECAACPEPVRKGHEVEFNDKGSLIHSEHAREPEDPPRQTCPWCRIQLPKSGKCCH